MLIDTTTIYNKISEMSINKPNFMPYLLKKTDSALLFLRKKEKEGNPTEKNRDCPLLCSAKRRDSITCPQGLISHLRQQIYHQYHFTARRNITCKTMPYAVFFRSFSAMTVMSSLFTDTVRFFAVCASCSAICAQSVCRLTAETAFLNGCSA